MYFLGAVSEFSGGCRFARVRVVETARFEGNCSRNARCQDKLRPMGYGQILRAPESGQVPLSWWLGCLKHPGHFPFVTEVGTPLKQHRGFAHLVPGGGIQKPMIPQFSIKGHAERSQGSTADRRYYCIIRTVKCGACLGKRGEHAPVSDRHPRREKPNVYSTDALCIEVYQDVSLRLSRTSSFTNPADIVLG